MVRTPSEENASRAEQAAKVQVKGKIQTVQKDGAFVVQMGPFPNRYLAQQGLQKAQGYGFPARIRELGGAEGVEEPLASISPRAFRRLTPKGSGRSIQPPPPVDLQAEVTDAPPPKRMTIEVPAEPPMGQEPNSELHPLPLFSEEDLALDPLPPTPEETILVEPLAKPPQEELQPDLGLVPAPMARQKSSPQPIKISPATPRGLSRPPQYSQGPPSQNRRPPMNQGPRNVRPLGPRPAPAPDLRTMPRPDQEFQAKDPEVVRPPQPRP